jgi:hypothetical protein
VRTVFNTLRASKAVRMFLLIFVMVAVFVLGYRFYEQRRAELEQIVFSTSRQTGFAPSDIFVDFDDTAPFTLLMIVQGESEQKPVIDGFAIFRLYPSSGTADVISVHPGLYTALQRIPDAPFARTDLSAAKIRDLLVIGELQNPPIPLAYAVYQLEELFGIAVDGYIVFPPEIRDSLGSLSAKPGPDDVVGDVESIGYEKWAEEWGGYWVDYFRSLSLVNVWIHRGSVGKIESNMDVLDVYSFSKKLSSIPADDVNILAVPDEQVSEIVDDRGEVVNSVGIPAIDAVLAELSPDERMAREQARIEILNGTSTAGFGARYERWIRHLGGDVIRVKNAPSTTEKSVIYVTDADEYGYTVGRIAGLWEEVEIREGRPDFITTGDVIIVLGMDF